jgi:membrane-bound metal-dependent hydrolase YbcI (DUF457 family)
MYPTGHFAINLILVGGVNRYAKAHIKLPLWPALLAAILPDITDKVVTDYLHWMPYGRNYLHNLTAVLLGGLLLYAWFERLEIALSWMLGLLGHLIGDFVYIPWLWPWWDYLWPNETRQIAQGVVQTVMDLAQGKALSPLAAVVWQYGRLAAETVMLAGTAVFIHPCFKPREQQLGLLLAVLCWGYVVYVWDLWPFLNTLQYFGLKSW